MRVIRVLWRSTAILWQNKFLWVLGILPIFLNESVNTILTIFNSDRLEVANLHPEWASVVVNVRTQIEFTTWLWLGVLFLAILFAVLGVLLELSIYRAVVQICNGQDREDFGQLLNQAKRKFWRLLGLRFTGTLTGLIIIVPVGLVTALVIFLQTNFLPEPPSNFYLAVVLIVFLLFVKFLIQTIVNQGVVFIVAEEQSALDAFDHSAKLVEKNILKYLPIVMFLGLLTFGFWVAAELPYLDFTLPNISTNMADFEIIDLVEQVISLSKIDITPIRPIGWLPLTIVFEGLFTAFNAIVWTSMYLEIRGEPATEAIDKIKLAAA